MHTHSSQKGFIQHSVCHCCRGNRCRNGKLSAGFTLFYAMLIASLMLAIGLAIFNITFKELILSSGARDSSDAFYAADTGLECALYWDLKHAAIGTPAFGYYGDSLGNGLLGYWRFQEGSGLTTADSSGRNNTGTLSGGPTWTTGKIGNGLSFDGVNDYVDINQIDLPGPFTISVWYNETNDGAFARMISGGGPGDNGGAGRKFGFLNNNGSFSFLVRIINGGSVDASVPAVVGGWHHMVLRRNTDNTVDLIIDNVYHRLSFGGVPQQAGPFQIYDIGDTPGQFYLGSLDDFRVYNRALSSTEITDLYNLSSNLQFSAPIPQYSGVTCNGVDITNPSTGWDVTSGWNVTANANAATTTFDMLLPSSRCATITVAKTTGTTTITSRGYNDCDLNDPRRVERAIKATY